MTITHKQTDMVLGVSVKVFRKTAKAIEKSPQLFCHRRSGDGATFPSNPVDLRTWMTYVRDTNTARPPCIRLDESQEDFLFRTEWPLEWFLRAGIKPNSTRLRQQRGCVSWCEPNVAEVVFILRKMARDRCVWVWMWEGLAYFNPEIATQDNAVLLDGLYGDIQEDYVRTTER